MSEKEESNSFDDGKKEGSSPFDKWNGKAVLITTKSCLKYYAPYLKVYPRYVEFTDKSGCRFFLANSEIKSISKENKEDNDDKLCLNKGRIYRNYL